MDRPSKLSVAIVTITCMVLIGGGAGIYAAITISKLNRLANAQETFPSDVAVLVVKNEVKLDALREEVVELKNEVKKLQSKIGAE